jgi:argininosuccinate lyase
MIARGLERGYLDATTLMEFLIRRGMPQRTAHHAVGELVGKAMELGIPLSELSLDQFRGVDPGIDENVYGILGAENAVNAFVSYGSTSPGEVARQVMDWKKRLGMNCTT